MVDLSMGRSQTYTQLTLEFNHGLKSTIDWSQILSEVKYGLKYYYALNIALDWSQPWIEGNIGLNFSLDWSQPWYSHNVVCSMLVMDALDVVCHMDTSLLLDFTMLKITLHHRLQLVWFSNTRGYNVIKSNWVQYNVIQCLNELMTCTLIGY